MEKNKPYSYSHGWTGTSIQWRLVRGISFEFEKIPPHWPLLHVSASPTVRIRISSIVTMFVRCHARYGRRTRWELVSLWVQCARVRNEMNESEDMK